MSRSEEGLTDDGSLAETADIGALVLRLDGVEVRESTWAGAYYCAHVLYVATRWSRSPSSSLSIDRDGDPLLGFIHVPADLESSGVQLSRSAAERHATTSRILGCALRGVADELRTGPNATVEAPRRVLITGFGPFAAVVSNPTGDLVSDETAMASTIGNALGREPMALDALPADGNGRPALPAHAVDGFVVARLRLDVDDACLDLKKPGSLPWALEKFRPHALIAMGVHRASALYRVELEPTSAGLCYVDGSAPKHERGRPMDAREARNRAIARAIERGAKTLGLG